MQVKIHDPIVRQNLEFFLMILRRVESRVKKKQEDPQHVFSACLHRETGQILLEELFRNPSFLHTKEWKPIFIRYHYDAAEGTVLFEIDESKEETRDFHTGDLNPLACRVISQTLKTLNGLCSQLKGPSDLKTKITALSHLKIATETSAQDRNLIVSSWHAVDRLGAEDLLKDKPVGTFLFRKDEYASILEQQLRQHMKKQVHCITLTYKASQAQICDVTLVHSMHQWFVYNDDPALQQNSYADIKEVLKNFSSLLRFPLYH